MAVRPIDGNALIEWFRPYLHSDEPIPADVVIEDIRSMPTLTTQNEWVSVEERLPGVSGNYICAVKDKNGGKWTIPAEWSLEMKMWIGAFGEIKNIVTHWMPLPKSPKEDE